MNTITIQLTGDELDQIQTALIVAGFYSRDRILDIQDCQREGDAETILDLQEQVQQYDALCAALTTRAKEASR